MYRNSGIYSTTNNRRFRPKQNYGYKWSHCLNDSRLKLFNSELPAVFVAARINLEQLSDKFVQAFANFFYSMLHGIRDRMCLYSKLDRMEPERGKRL